MKDEDIDAMLKRTFQPPADLNEKIMAAVRRDALVQSSRHKHFWRYFSGIAAALVFVAVAFAVWHKGDVTEEPPIIIAAQEPVKDYHLDRAFSVYDSQNEDAPVYNENLTLANTKSMSYQNTATFLKKHKIADIVNHVWIVPSFEEADKLLKHIGDVNEKSFIKDGEKDGNVLYSITLTDSELQNLVDMLSDENWALVSRSYPQPEKAYSFMFSSKPVNYKLCLVKGQE